MEDKYYLARPGKMFYFTSSRTVFDFFKSSQNPLKNLPVPCIAVHGQKDDVEVFYVWKIISSNGLYVLPLFNDGKQDIPQKDLTIYPMIENQIFFYNNYLYTVKFNTKEGYYIKNIKVLYQEDFAKAEATFRGFPNANFMLCRVFVIGRENKQIGLTWVGYCEEENTSIYVKLFQDDLKIFAKYTPSELSTEAVKVGEIFSHNDEYWVLKQNENEAYYIERLPFKIVKH